MNAKEISDMPKALRLLADQITAPDHIPAMCLRDAAAMIETLNLWVETGKVNGNRVAVERDRLEAAIRWALGEGDSDFAPQPAGKGRYWWRTELRKRAALIPENAIGEVRADNATPNQNRTL
jgi:hypothetical protein